jgi:signal transduction histidine kinase
VRRRHHLPVEAVALAGPAPEAMIVDGDVDELRTAIGNLLDNAVKYSTEGVKITVELAAPSPDTLWVRVRDRGVGIPRRQLRRIFNRFHRFQARGLTVKGTGLGLYIVRSIARQHGGRVFAESRGEGQGATFTLELPKFSRGAA